MILLSEYYQGFMAGGFATVVGSFAFERFAKNGFADPIGWIEAALALGCFFEPYLMKKISPK